MRFLPLILALLTGVFGLYLGLRTYRKFVGMTRGEIAPGELVRNSILAGIAGFFLFFTIIMVMGFFDEAYVWSVNKLYAAIGFALIPGGVIAIGSFVQSLMIIGYKKVLHDYLRQENRNK